jgi:hypothetical protein
MLPIIVLVEMRMLLLMLIVMVDDGTVDMLVVNYGTGSNDDNDDPHA